MISNKKRAFIYVYTGKSRGTADFKPSWVQERLFLGEFGFQQTQCTNFLGRLEVTEIYSLTFEGSKGLKSRSYHLVHSGGSKRESIV